MKRKRGHYSNLIIFFSFLFIIASVLPLLITKNSQTTRKENMTEQLLPKQSSVMLHELQIIRSASISGTVICSTQDPNKCNKYPQNTVLEYSVGCNGSESSSSIYICKDQGVSGKWWTYVSWTTHGSCHFCPR